MEFEKPRLPLCSFADRLVSSPEYKRALRHIWQLRDFRLSAWTKLLGAPPEQWFFVEMTHSSFFLASAALGRYDFARIHVK